MVGLSPKTVRPSNEVAAYLQEAGYRIVPVNPGHDRILGERSYRTLARLTPDEARRVELVDMANAIRPRTLT